MGVAVHVAATAAGRHWSKNGSGGSCCCNRTFQLMLWAGLTRECKASCSPRLPVGQQSLHHSLVSQCIWVVQVCLEFFPGMPGLGIAGRCTVNVKQDQSVGERHESAGQADAWQARCCHWHDGSSVPTRDTGGSLPEAATHLPGSTAGSGRRAKGCDRTEPAHPAHRPHYSSGTAPSGCCSRQGQQQQQHSQVSLSAAHERRGAVPG